MYWSTRVAAVLLAIVAVTSAVTLAWLNRPVTPPHPAPAHAAPAAPAVAEPITESIPINSGDTLENVLGRSGIDSRERVEIISAAKGIFDLRKLRAGSHLTLTRSFTGAPVSLEYVIDPDHKLELSRSGGVFQAAVVEIPGEVRLAAICGTMQGSLFESIELVGERADLALQVADIFAWDLDFYTDPQPGDEFCLVVEKKEYANAQPPTYRRILAARYDNAGTVYQGYLFPDGKGKPRYYSADGRSLESAFLRSPLKFDARVSSRFSRRRFHPVLKIYRPHLGTDYAAPTGSPVQAVASGKVTFSGRAGGAGNMIRLAHENGYESLYLHLSRRFVRVGQRVTQGQRIASVGATGIATGPHLDFRLRRNGRYVDFERLKSPPAGRLGADRMAAFTADRDRFAALMDQGRRPVATAVAEIIPAAPAETAGGDN